MSSKTPPFRHAELLYKALNKAAKVEKGTKLFKGSQTELYASIKLSMTYYTVLWKVLEDIGSISRLQRGSRNVDSVVAVFGPPKFEQYEKVVGTYADLTNGETLATLSRRVRDLVQQIGGVDIGEALASLQEQIDELRREVRSGKTKK